MAAKKKTVTRKAAKKPAPHRKAKVHVADAETEDENAEVPGPTPVDVLKWRDNSGNHSAKLTTPEAVDVLKRQLSNDPDAVIIKGD